MRCCRIVFCRQLCSPNFLIFFLYRARNLDSMIYESSIDEHNSKCRIVRESNRQVLRRINNIRKRHRPEFAFDEFNDLCDSFDNPRCILETTPIIQRG